MRFPCPKFCAPQIAHHLNLVHLCKLVYIENQGLKIDLGQSEIILDLSAIIESDLTQ